MCVFDLCVRCDERAVVFNSCVYVFMFVCIYACMYVCACVLYVYMYACLFICIYVCVYVRWWACRTFSCGYTQQVGLFGSNLRMCERGSCSSAFVLIELFYISLNNASN
jgi:hypothetical protein